MNALAVLSLLLHVAAVVYYATARGAESRRVRRGHVATALAGSTLLALLIWRSVVIGFPALTGTYEGLVTIALAVDVVLLVGSRRLLHDDGTALAVGAFVALAWLLVLISPVIPSAARPPMPVLRSAWLVIHVAFAFIGLALFSVAALFAAVAFRVADPTRLDGARDRAIALGFLFYATGGLVFGAIWAEAAWGRFWGWDPKETWALITTLGYTGYLHLRYVRKVSQRTARTVAIVCWIVAIFTFFGVNYLLSGLHSYT